MLLYLLVRNGRPTGVYMYHHCLSSLREMAVPGWLLYLLAIHMYVPCVFLTY